MTTDDLGLGDDVLFAVRPGTSGIPDAVRNAGGSANGDRDEFWSCRTSLAHIRDAARARRTPPTAVLGAVLARVAAFTPPSTCVPAFVGGHVPLSLYVALVAGTGGGKSSPARVAADLLPDPPPGVVGPLPLGSGEGVAAAFVEIVDERDAQGRKVKRKLQTRHGALFDLDEGRVLAEMAQRRGSTIAGVLCTAWTGGDLGQANATIDTYRHVPAGRYSLGLVSLWQPAKLAGLLDEAEAGLPGRFLFIPTSDPDAPDGRPPWPGPLDWQPPAKITSPNPLGCDDGIAAEVDAERLAVLRDETTVRPLDAHRTLHRLKLSGLLAVLDGRHRIDPDDWRLAATLLRTSNRLRAEVVATVQFERDRKVQAGIDLHVRREVAAADSAERSALVSGARSMARKARSEHSLGNAVNRRVLSRAVSGKHRDLVSLDDMIAHAVAEGWLECDGDCDGEHYLPGRSEPA